MSKIFLLISLCLFSIIIGSSAQNSFGFEVEQIGEDFVVVNEEITIGEEGLLGGEEWAAGEDQWVVIEEPIVLDNEAGQTFAESVAAAVDDALGSA